MLVIEAAINCERKVECKCLSLCQVCALRILPSTNLHRRILMHTAKTLLFRVILSQVNTDGLTEKCAQVAGAKLLIIIPSRLVLSRSMRPGKY